MADKKEQHSLSLQPEEGSVCLKWIHSPTFGQTSMWPDNRFHLLTYADLGLRRFLLHLERLCGSVLETAQNKL